MSLSTIIDRVMPVAPEGWSRSTGALSALALIREAVDELFDYDSESLIFRSQDPADSNKGWPPYLKTTAGKFEYEIKTENLNKAGALKMYINGSISAITVVPKIVRRVFVDVTNTRYDYNRVYIGKPYQYSVTPFARTQLDRIWVCDIAGSSIPKMGDALPMFRFLEDPGTTTETYFVEFTYGHPVIASENDQLLLASKFEQGIEAYIYGRWGVPYRGGMDGMSEWMNRWVPEFRSSMNDGVQTGPKYTRLRRC